MVVGILILAVILVYSGWVITRKVGKIRSGQFCDCGHCSQSCGNRGCKKEFPK